MLLLITSLGLLINEQFEHKQRREMCKKGNFSTMYKDKKNELKDELNPTVRIGSTIMVHRSSE